MTDINESTQLKLYSIEHRFEHYCCKSEKGIEAVKSFIERNDRKILPVYIRLNCDLHSFIVTGGIYIDEDGNCPIVEMNEFEELKDSLPESALKKKSKKFKLYQDAIYEYIKRTLDEPYDNCGCIACFQELINELNYDMEFEKNHITLKQFDGIYGVVRINIIRV